MEFGRWELRNDSSYYFSKDAIIWPSSNALDEGKLTTEENLRNIYRDLTDRNFVTKYNYFNLSLNANRNGVIVSPGEAVIQGYHFYTKNTVEVKVPDNRIQNENGTYSSGPIIQYTLGISLSYDAANHVTGDIINREGITGESEMLSGVYLKWFDECQLECYYDNILVLGRAWVQNGAIVKDGTMVDGRIIYHGFEPDPFKDHKYYAESVELEIHGHATTIYDTLRDNMSQIHEQLYTYDSMHFPIELDRQDRTKPPSFVTDIQDYVNHLPDWYTSKYGDYMTGALRFNNLSIDAMREFMNESRDTDLNPYIKDSTNISFQDSVLISPRTYGDLVRYMSDTVASRKDPNSEKEIGQNYDYNVGGTVMSIVPGSYKNTTDYNNGYTGIHSSLVAQRYGETGLRIHTGEGNETTINNYTRLVHYNKNDTGTIYNKANTNNTNNLNTSKFIIENVDTDNRRVSIDMKNGELFIDSYTVPVNNKYKETNITNNKYNGKYSGSGIQFFTSGVDTDYHHNIDFRIDEYNISMAAHQYINHRTSTRGTQSLGKTTDNLHFKVGLGSNYDNNIEYDSNNNFYKYEIIEDYTNTDPYLHLGNLRLRSNTVDGNYDIKQNTIEIINTGDDKGYLPYIRLKPRVYSEQYLAESVIQLGTTKYDDYTGNNAEDNTLNRIIMKKVGINNEDNTTNSYTYLEQDFRLSTGTGQGQSKIFNKWITPTNIANNNIMENNAPIYEEIAGMYSAGNIGCSTGWLSPGNSNKNENSTEPYANDKEWVRFTRFRYNNDKDQVNGGTYTEAHNANQGRQWGTPYNIEFNTNVANERANQIIWRFNGSTGVQDNINLKNTPPVILSYIHDSTEEQGTPTKYTNWKDSDNPGYNGGKGTFETYIDHNGNTHRNPTNKVRDFLLLENAGLSVAGDINNPSWCGDTLNTNNHLGVTIVQGRVYNAVYNDFAETYEKNDINEIAQVGELIALNPETGKYQVCEGFENELVVGVQSNTYAFLAGGNRINNTQDILDLEQEYFTVGIAGKVWVRVTDDSYIFPGDLITSSFEKGKAMKSEYKRKGTIIGKALTQPKYFEEYKCYMILMQIMLG